MMKYHIEIDDLLGRKPIKIDNNSIISELNNKCVLVTGAAGSIGSEIVRLISTFNPSKLVLCDCAESPLYGLHLELQSKFPDLIFVPSICNIRNKERLAAVFSEHKPEYVFHAAAYKHVPLMELHPVEAVLTNVMGTKNVADLSVDYNVKTFVLISTDKAVNPGNVMGATKRAAEIYIQSLYENRRKNNQSTEKNIKFITTRFGNVLGSNGSVVPIFESQIARGGPVTVTHPEVMRYFMTISEACGLVLEAGVMGKGGEIFVFDMGEPIKILDLAKQMIFLSGLIPEKDIKIEFIGLRPGEKLYEELLTQKEFVKPTHHEKIMIAEVEKSDHLHIKNEIELLIQAAKEGQDPITIVKKLKSLVPEFISCNSLYNKIDKEES